MVAPIVPAWQFRLMRRFPRMPFAVPVEVFFQGTVFTAQSLNLSLGGMLLQGTCDLPMLTQLHVCFPLPTGASIVAAARVVHCRPDVRVGVEFINLESATLDALRHSIKTEQSGQRRSIRIPERLYLYLQWEEDGTPMQRIAETVLLSRHGCLLLTDAVPRANALLRIRWLDTGAVTSARVVSKEKYIDGMFTIALAFTEDANFWGIDFAAEESKLTS